MRYGLSPTQEVQQVEQRKADWSADGIPGNLLHEVKTRFPRQWHSLAPATETDWLQLNTTIPPFNDIRVRQALNLAIDRAAIVRMYGGPLTATPTCQILPPAFPDTGPTAHAHAGRAPTDAGAPPTLPARAPSSPPPAPAATRSPPTDGSAAAPPAQP